MTTKIKLTPEQLADKWIKEMIEMGLTPDEMLMVIRKARQIFNERRALKPKVTYRKPIKHI